MLVNEALCDFVGTVIVGNFLADDENLGVAGELLV